MNMKNPFTRKEHPSLKCEAFGIGFPHPVALAPGFVPDGERYNSFPGFAFVEIGPLTLKKQGDTGVRKLFSMRRTARSQMANLGIRNSIQHMQERPPKTVIAANLAPMFIHRSTDDIVKDITSAFSLMYDFADMFIIDTFRANADGVVALQNIDILSEVLDSVLDMRICYEVTKPVLVRVVPTIPRALLEEILDYMRRNGVDGIIAGYDSDPAELVNDIVRMTDGRYPVIACGGIDTPEKAAAMLDAGACLVQAVTSPRRIIKHLEERGQTPLA